MTAVLVTAAEALKAVLAAHDFGIPVTVERSYAEWDIELPVLKDARIDVAPVRHKTTDLDARGQLLYEVDIDVAIRKRFQAADNAADGRIDVAAIDPLVQLVEDVHELMAAQLLGESPWAACDILWCPNKRHLRTLRQFTGLVRLTYETIKPLPA